MYDKLVTLISHLQLWVGRPRRGVSGKRRITYGSRNQRVRALRLPHNRLSDTSGSFLARVLRYPQPPQPILTSLNAAALEGGETVCINVISSVERLLQTVLHCIRQQLLRGSPLFGVHMMSEALLAPPSSGMRPQVPPAVAGAGLLGEPHRRRRWPSLQPTAERRGTAKTCYRLTFLDTLGSLG